MKIKNKGFIFAAVSLIASSKDALAQAISFGIGGDQIQSTVSTAGAYLQKLALGLFVIILIVAGVRVALDPQHREGLGVVWGCIAGIAITVLAPVIVQVVRGWSGGIFGF